MQQQFHTEKLPIFICQMFILTKETGDRKKDIYSQLNYAEAVSSFKVPITFIFSHLPVLHSFK